MNPAKCYSVPFIEMPEHTTLQLFRQIPAIGAKVIAMIEDWRSKHSTFN